jgi:hypothetical protein
MPMGFDFTEVVGRISLEQSILYLVCCYLLLKLILCTDYTEMFFCKTKFS